MSKNVLIIDDDRDLTTVLAERFTRLGMTPLVAHNALTAVFTLQSKKIDLICMDVDMPTGDGLTMCETILADKSIRCPIIIITGLADAATRKRCLSLCVYCIRKGPDLWDRLRPVVYELVDLPACDDDEDVLRGNAAGGRNASDQ